MIKLIVGLGNPGNEYKNTRHNIGFMIIDNFIKSRGLKLDKEKFKGKYLYEYINGDKVIFLEPQKYMNLSGEVIREFIEFFKIDKENILVISDDVSLPLGKIRLRLKGSSGGHNGLKNIELNLSSQEYKRMKIGIGSNNNCEMKNYVLGKFSNSDLEILRNTFEITNEIIENFLNDSFEKLMNKYN